MVIEETYLRAWYHWISILLLSPGQMPIEETSLFYFFLEQVLIKEELVFPLE